MFLASVGWVKTQQNIKVVLRLFQTTLPYTLTLTCFVYNENGQHQWKVPSKEENARNGLPETDWRDAQYDMLYLPVTETVRYHYDFNGNRTATVLPDGRQINYLYYGSGHLHQISLDDEVITDIERDRLHREIYCTQGKLASRYELDPSGRLKKQIAALNELTQTETAKNAVTSVYAVKCSYGYDRTGNLIHRELVDCEVQNYFYDRHDQLVKAEVFKKDGTKLLEIP